MAAPPTDPRLDAVLSALAARWPEAFVDGQLDPEVLVDLLGEPVPDPSTTMAAGGIDWPGRHAAALEAFVPPSATLDLDPSTSRDVATTANTLVVGDNLEVLRCLLPAQAGSAKLLLIDPPYNTGNRFTYNDSFAAGGDSHAAWMSMMYPRLLLGRELLTRDGVCAINIAEEEVAHLRLLCDLVFGEDNRVALCTWRRRHNQPNDKSKMVAQVAEYVLLYARDAEYLKAQRSFYGVPMTASRRGAYTNPDADPRGPWTTKPWKSGSGQSGTTYTITSPDGTVYTEEWLGTAATFKSLLADKRIHWSRNGAGLPRKKVYLSERDAEGVAPTNFWGHDEWGSNQEATDELTALFGTKQVFDGPKPTRLLSRIVGMATHDDDLVVDFFAGSGSTGHAVWSANAADGGHRRVLLVQSDEEAHPGRAGGMLGYRTIADICIARLDKAATALAAEGYKGDTGLRVLRTTPIVATPPAPA